MRIWRWEVIRGDIYDDLMKSWDMRMAADAQIREHIQSDCDLLREEKRVLSESLDRCKGANAAIIEQREELARQLRERKR